MNHESQEGCVQAPGCIHKGMIRAGHGTDLATFPKLHMDGSSQDGSLTGKKG